MDLRYSLHIKIKAIDFYVQCKAVFKSYYFCPTKAHFSL